MKAVLRREQRSVLALVAIIAATFIFLILLYRFFQLPTADEFIHLARNYYAQYGYSLVFVAALIEGLLLLNWYLPGSAVAVIGVVFAKENNQSVVAVIALITAAFMITTMVNYALGKYGWYRLFLKLGLTEPLRRTRERLERVGPALIFSTYFHPNIGALTATSAGILNIPFPLFFLYSTIALLFWSTVWGAVVYYFGPALLEFGTVQLMAVILMTWMIFFLVRNYLDRRTHPHRKS